MSNNIIVINGPNLNLLGKREQSQYGAITFEQLKENCQAKAKELNVNLEFYQSNIEGEIVTRIQKSKNEHDGIIINAAGFTHTSVAIRDALDIFKKPIIELHISNIYKREEFRQKSLISDIATGGIFGLGDYGYILAIISIQNMLKNENR
ncbi:type II 3-dehydroquinate dehydratase [Candidatus Pelagibacter sp.]|nr:type II 3-dehydroquinate dehydratase [Candidatus Pelagibacter sp.]